VIRFGNWFDRLTEQEICFPCNLSSNKRVRGRRLVTATKEGHHVMAITSDFEDPRDFIITRSLQYETHRLTFHVVEPR
jgi:hypothetical protein